MQLALEEDLVLGDATTDALFPRAVPAVGTIVVQEDCVLAGLAAARLTFRVIDPALNVTAHVEDGARVSRDTPVLEIRGDGRSILKAERVALNFLQHLSGVATLTARYCEAVAGHPTIVLDTRKTTPGLRALEKWAVRLGGGRNHRSSLGDGILIKDNHLALMRGERTRVLEACRTARRRGRHGLRIIVEVESIDGVDEALEAHADVILLDNMEPAEVRRSVERIKGRALVEVSGGITPARAGEMAAAGADCISIGALTHSAPAVGFSLELRRSASGSRTLDVST